jgi:hypothetical protein
VQAQFHEDHTATFSIINKNVPKIFVGAWKCLGHNCYQFCTALPLDATTKESINGELCFNHNDCKSPTGNVIIAAECLELSLERVSCCK